MIVKDKLSWLQLLFSFRGSDSEDTWLRVLTATGVAVVVTWLKLRYDLLEYTLTTTPFTLIGTALGIFLGFRNNAAYDRFWEGRKLWGAMVNTSRSLTRQAFTLIDSPGDQDELSLFRRRFVRRIIAFVHALRHHLRNTDPFEEIAPYLPAADLLEVRPSSHRPLIILQQLGRDLAQARDQQWIAEVNVSAVDDQLVELSNIMGACERIKNTPIPFAYTVLSHRMVTFYCLFLPFGLVDTTKLLTPVVVFLIAEAFYGLDAIGDEIENPFGTLSNHLPLATISRSIEINLLELLGDPNRPAPLQPQNGVAL